MISLGDMLSQAEIDALLNGSSLDGPANTEFGPDSLTLQEIDALGEIGNICMGTSATTLFTLLGQKVTITTPKVEVSTWDQIAAEFSNSYVAVKVEYTKGLKGSNLLILKEDDVKVIADLMMGGDGSNTSGSLTDFHLSAISEAMNQMVGSASTSMSTMFDKRIDISPPKAFRFEMGALDQSTDINVHENVVKIAFKMVIGNIVDSEIMQILPISFAKKLVENLLSMDTGSGTYEIPLNHDVPRSQQQPAAPASDRLHGMEPAMQQPGAGIPQPQMPPQPQFQPNQTPPQSGSYNMGGYEQYHEQPGSSARQYREPVSVQPAQFQSFDDDKIVLEKRNISLIMDVPLQVTVELGRTNKMIKEILELGPGSIIELDKLAGEPVDILVNGKSIAKGEVVVIDESFGVRVTDIIHPSKRL